MIFNRINISLHFVFISLSFYITACSYSFTGASVPPHLNSVAIPLFDDRSGSGEPNLREDFTNELIQKFIDDNTLQIAERVNADAVLECTVLSIDDAPATVGSVEGDASVTTRRVNINVRVVYRDFVKRETIFEQSFSNFGDYPTGGDITLDREIAIETAIDKITEDILLAVVSNW